MSRGPDSGETYGTALWHLPKVGLGEAPGDFTSSSVFSYDARSSADVPQQWVRRHSRFT